MSSIERYEPQVISKANPEPPDLLEGRRRVQSDPTLKGIFLKAQESGSTADDLAKELAGYLEPDVAQFLADEYAQLGATGIHLVSTETGRVVLTLTEKDIYQPAPVPRENSTTLATPLPRIRPELESAIVSWVHDKDREQDMLRKLSEKGYQTELLQTLGDPRLLIATTRGRKHITASLARQDPKALLGSVGGTAGAFLNLFEVVEEAPAGDFTHLGATVASSSVMGVQDPLTTNLQHNRPSVMRGAMVQNWLRLIAAHIAVLRHKQGSITTLTIAEALRLKGALWAAPADAVLPLQPAKIPVLPIDGPAVLFQGPLGYLKVPPEFRLGSREIVDRWETRSELDFEVWLNLDNVAPYRISDLAYLAQVF